ncbi:MAG: polysaccharide biosynthesis/export family protein [Cyanobacteria bacterium P01_F01_bin.150]
MTMYELSRHNFAKKAIQSTVVLMALGSVWQIPEASAQVSTQNPAQASGQERVNSLVNTDRLSAEPTFSSISPSSTTNILPSVAKSTYVLDTGDQISISVFGYDEFTGTWIVLPDGTISLPLIGSVIVTGQTPDSFAAYLTERLDEYLVDPVVAVAPSVLRPVIVNVAGEVRRPGPLQLRSLSAVDPNITVEVANSRAPSTLESVPTLSSALVEAGGITLDADIRSVVVTRARPGQEPESTTINLWNSIWSDALPEDLLLQDGDAIFVPRLENDTDINRRLLVESNYAPESIAVRVMGEVKRPGETNVSPTSSISGAIASAGGHTTDGRLRHVALVRLNPDGSVFQKEFDLRDLNDEEQIKEGDIIYVPQQNSSGILDFAGRLLSPINSMLGILRLFDN